MIFEPALSPEVNATPSIVIVVCGTNVLKSDASEEILLPAAPLIKTNPQFQHHLGTVQGAILDLIVTDESISEQFDEWSWTPLRALLGQLQEPLFQLAGKALQLSNWHETHQYCGRCGKPTTPADQNRSKYCTSCDLHFYPRVSPCVIGLVSDGNRCLLARNARHPEGRFSTIAGFIEPGETAEEAFAREVYEEVGVKVKNIRYAFSQPWPFPGQLMLGFYADYAGNEIQVDNVEIVEADWFEVDNLPQTPPESTISGVLIREFVSKVKG